jgi:hypothetical protein
MVGAGEVYHVLKFLQDSVAAGSSLLAIIEGLAVLGAIFWVIDRLSK